MRLQQSNRLSMIEAVTAYLSLYPEHLAESTDFAAALDLVKDLADDIRAKDNQKSGATAGKSNKKSNTAKQLMDKLLIISSALFLWAQKNNDHEITVLANISKSDFKRARDNEKVNKAVAIYEAANGKDLAFANVTAEDITSLNTLAGEFRNALSDLHSGTSIRAAAGESLTEMMNQALRIIKEQLDKFMIGYSISDPEFYSGYKSARAIWDKRGRRKEEEPVEQPQE